MIICSEQGDVVAIYKKMNSCLKECKILKIVQGTSEYSIGASSTQSRQCCLRCSQGNNLFQTPLIVCGDSSDKLHSSNSDTIFGHLRETHHSYLTNAGRKTLLHFLKKRGSMVCCNNVEGPTDYSAIPFNATDWRFIVDSSKEALSKQSW